MQTALRVDLDRDTGELVIFPRTEPLFARPANCRLTRCTDGVAACMPTAISGP